MSTAVYFVFVNNEHKVQLLKRLDIVHADLPLEQQRKIWNKNALEFLAESKNLFDLMAEEDPGYRMGQMLENAGIFQPVPERDDAAIMR